MTSFRLTGRAYDSGVRRAGLYLAAGVGLLTAVVLAAVGVGDRPGALSDWQALVLGIVQGLTELLPISSSGHLILVPWLADWHYLEAHPDFNKTFDVALHLGTLVAVVVYFWRDVLRYLKAWFRSLWRRAISATDERIAWYIFAATVPAAIAGAAGEDFIEEKLGQPWQIAFLLASFGILLWIADRTPERRGIDELRFKAAFLVGISQILALMPGVSRSGITITSGRFAGLDRDSAARFSFLLLIPIVAGAVVYKGVKHVAIESLPPGSTGPFVVGTLAAASVGLVAIDLLLGYVRRHNYTPFVIYRLVLAGIVLALIATGVREATF
jgi:undecaprenyl-diphosphatase